jgi:hypothetical protein
MANNPDKTYNQACDALITQIKLTKLNLELKYGPQIKKKWAARERFTQ